MPKTYKEGGEKDITIRERVNMFLTGSRDGVLRGSSKTARQIKAATREYNLMPGERVRAKRKP
jgi:hypothetical protein